MAYTGNSYVEHVAVRVKDLDWHVRFFRDVLGMTIRDVEGPRDAPRQVWTVGGVQLVADPTYDGPEGRLVHLGIMAEDQEAVLAAARAWGVSELPQGRNYLALPSGLSLEIIQAAPGSVAAALAVKPRG
jgi:catechol 2,3-dioxygenase-like lactoylglutathione lyase family enzyme